MLKNIPLMATGDNIEATVLLVCWIDSCPRSDSRLRPKPSAEVEFILMPRETETNLRCFPNKQRVDAENIWTEDVNEWIGEARITDAGEEFWIVATWKMDFVHRIDALLFGFAVSDECVLIDVYGWKRSFSVHNIFSHLTKGIVFFRGKYVQTDEGNRFRSNMPVRPGLI